MEDLMASPTVDSSRENSAAIPLQDESCQSTQTRSHSGRTFYIEKPQDEYWNTMYPNTVIEGEDSNLADKWSSIKVLSPESFSKKWPTVHKQYFFKCSGPVRELSDDEYVEFIHSLQPNLKLPKGCKIAQEKSTDKVTESLQGGMIKLKNGATIPHPHYTATWVSINSLMNKNPIAFYELVMICRDPTHQLFGNTTIKLQELALLDESGQPHSSTRDLVLSSVRGEGLEMSLSSPIEKVHT
jgi:hypothetical protein